MLRHLFLSAILALSLPMGAALADSLNPVERASLQARIDAHEVARVKGDLRVLMSAMPPKVIPAIAGQTGASAGDVRKMIEDAISQAYDQQSFESHALDLDAAEHGETPTGLAYLLIPTETIVTFQDKTYRMTSHTLAFQENGVWYLSRVTEGPPLQTLQMAYPDFATIDFPQGNATVVKE